LGLPIVEKKSGFVESLFENEKGYSKTHIKPGGLVSGGISISVPGKIGMPENIQF
jgi:hypothetical protein